MKRTALCVALAALSFAANAQVTVLENGKTYFGEMPTGINPNDPYNEVTLQVFGPDTKTGAKGMIAFGDHGRVDYDGRNVVIGEYGGYDSDQLWLHGKNGIYLTKNRGEDNSDVIGFYNQESKNFTFKGLNVTGADLNVIGAELNVNGAIFISSDMRLKSNIKPINNSLDKLMKLNGVSYNLLSKEVNANGLKSATVSQDENIGLIAQELLPVYPELVKQDSDGYYAVNYIGLIPVLIESIKEQQAQIEMLTEMMENGEYTKSNSLKSDILSTNAILKQNAPNPFTEETVIEFAIPLNAAEASIIVYDMTGAQLKAYKIMKGDNKLTIKGAEFKAGMYIYSLIVDGKLVDTKRMILTK